MVDAVLLLVDAAEGPLPADPLRAPEGDGAPPAGRRGHQQDRPRRRARRPRCSTRSTSCSSTSAPTTHQIDFPVVYTNAKAGTATLDLAVPGTDLRPLLDLLVDVTPPPTYEPGHPLQLLVTNLSANDYVGPDGGRADPERHDPHGPAHRGRARGGGRHRRRVEPGRTVTLTGTVTALTDGARASSASTSTRPGRATSSPSPGCPTSRSATRSPIRPTRGPLPRLDVDAPTLRMTFGVNTSPLSGREGKFLTCRQIKARLDREVLGNVSIEVYPTESADTFEVRGRGELQLAVLIEQMRREGFELQVSRPEVILREVDGEVAGAVRARHDRHPARVHRRGAARRWPAARARWSR